MFARITLLIVFFLSACAPKPVFYGVDITGADYAKGFVFQDQDGHPLKIESFKGSVVALFFGYTQCPDVCPTTMAEFKKIKDDLGVQSTKLQVLFVSVDPERDTPQVLKAYMNNFDASFIGYSPEVHDLEKIAQNFKIYYKKVIGTSNNSAAYTVDHSAGTYLFDTQGRIRLFIRYGMPREQIVKDVKSLMNEGG